MSNTLTPPPRYTTTSLYPEAAEPTLDPALFASPTARYRGTPFWSWNTKLERQRLLDQIDELAAMGMGGFHMHPRSGLATEYLGDEFLDLVEACVDHAEAKSMLAWLYDEDRWPSGAAGGLVTADPAYRMKHLVLTPRPYTADETAPPNFNTERSHARRVGGGTLVAKYRVVIDEAGRLASYQRLPTTAPDEPGLWYAYLETSETMQWFNGQAYLDCMMPEAVERFIAVTHEAYAERVGDRFGSVIPAIFTDEPQIAWFSAISEPHAHEDVILPWTTGLVDLHQQQWGEDPLDVLPEVVWQPIHQPGAARWRLRDTISERFASAFADQIGAWCDQHGIALTGHMMEEPTLASQATALGECMRHYRGFQLPGIDMLCDRIELTTAKQAASVAHQDGRPGVLSELYGVTNWDFTFAGHKRQGDWQAALGVTVRVHHLNWVSMAGDAKRDYPAAIGSQSPWWHEYQTVEDHFSRLNTVLTRGQPLVDVAIIHPIESYWVALGPISQTAVEQADLNQSFQDGLAWLLHGLIDADFVCESLLPKQCPTQIGSALRVGEMRYQTVVVPSLLTIRSTTLDRLEALAEAGGHVVFAGRVPALVDAQPSDRAQRLAANCVQVPWQRGELLASLDAVRRLSVADHSGYPVNEVLHQWRQDGDTRWLFLCNTNRDRGLGDRGQLIVRIRGHWRITSYDTLTGRHTPLTTHQYDGDTAVAWSTHGHDHLLLACTPSQPGRVDSTPTSTPALVWHAAGECDDLVPVTLHEPNVLPLDRLEWQLPDGAWQPVTEIMRLNNAVRDALGWQPVGGRGCQPWALPPEDAVGPQLRLRAVVHSAIDVEDLSIALERSSDWRVWVDGVERTASATGWWVDRDIHRVPLGSLSAGQHVFEFAVAVSERTTVETPYLLGDFGVQVRGRHVAIIAPVRELAWGDWTTQGLPFYGGSVTYHTGFEHAGGRAAIRCDRCPMPAWRVQVPAAADTLVAFAPYRADLGVLPAGRHRCDVVVYGNRLNTFGCLHNANPNEHWIGPQAWFTTGANWSEEYQLAACGMLLAPRVEQASA